MMEIVDAQNRCMKIEFSIKEQNRSILDMREYEKEQDRLRELLNDLTDEESTNIQYHEESDENEIDQEQFSEYNSKSEHEISKNEVRDSTNNSSLSYIMPSNLIKHQMSNIEVIHTLLFHSYMIHLIFLFQNLAISTLNNIFN